MKYYYLDGANKLGPFSKEEILSKNLNDKTLIFREDKDNWFPLLEFDELNPKNEVFNSKQNIQKKNFWHIKRNKNLFVVFFIVIFSIIGFGLYKHFSFTEKEARKTANIFFNMLMVENQNIKAFDLIYPDYKKISNYTIFKKKPKINSILKNENGDYEVYAAIDNKSFNKQIYLLLSKKNNTVYIKSSKGINYAHYNNLLEYGKKKGCLTGEEDDIEIGLKIKEKNLQWDFDIETSIVKSTIEKNIKIYDKIENRYGYISGNVTITNNNNNFDIEYGDLDCYIEFYDSQGNIVNSDKLLFYTINANSSKSSNVFSIGNADRYKIKTKINDSEYLQNKIRDIVLKQTINNCY